MPAPIDRLPLELVEDILLELRDDPSTVRAFLLTSKRFYTALGPGSNSHLYARMFRISFDHSAPSRRLGDLDAPAFCLQLRAHYDALRCIRRGDIRADNIVPTFWTCFSMLLENDGKNRTHLEAAGLPDFVDRFVRERLYEHSVDGWPAENEVNSLAVWLLWLTLDQDRLRAQTSDQRVQMVKLISPFVLVPVRYAAYLAPHVHYALPLAHDTPNASHSFPTAHGPHPQYRHDLVRTMPCYHVNRLQLSVPLASVAAKLIYFAHHEVFPVAIHPGLPTTRAHALQLGLTTVMPTQEDIREFNEHKVAKFVPRSTWEWWSEINGYDTLGSEARSRLAPSARWDNDWNRLADCTSVSRPVSLKRSHYTPGLLSGLWQGRMLYPDVAWYERLMQTAPMPNELSPEFTVAPLFMHLREYHCMDVGSNQPAPSGGIQNAWFHSSTRLEEDTHGLSITCMERTSSYDQYIAGGPDLHDESKCRGCQDRGTSEMILREDDDHYLAMAKEYMQNAEGDEDDVMDDGSNDEDVDMEVDDGNELAIKRKCDGILDTVLVGETDLRHGQAWHHYRFYGRVREWDGLVALIRVPEFPHLAPLGVWVFTGYAVGGQNFVGNWRTTAHPGEPVAVEGAFAMSKRE